MSIKSYLQTKIRHKPDKAVEKTKTETAAAGKEPIYFVQPDSAYYGGMLYCGCDPYGFWFL